MTTNTPLPLRTSHPTLTPLIPTTAYSLPPTPPSPALPPTTPHSYISSASLPPPPTILSRSCSGKSFRSGLPTPYNVNNNIYAQSVEPTSHPGSRHHSRRGTESTGLSGGSEGKGGGGREGMGGNGGGEKGGGNYDAETSWLTRTASALAMHAMEEKGRSWLASRSSATNFRPHSTDDDQNDDLTSPASREVGGEGNVSPVVYTRSAPHSRFASRTQSRVGSRAGSRVDVRMMRSQVGLSSMPMGEEGPGFAKRVVGIEGIEPDFVDLDEKDEEKVEGVDEGEMRRLVMGRVGGWVDWMVGWMDWRGDDGEEEGEEDGEDEGMEEGQGRQEVVEDTVMGKKERGVDDGTRLESGVSIPPAPEAAGRAWDDAKWLLKIAAESL